MPNKLMFLGALLSLLAVSACGFHLRSAVELPPILQDTYLESKTPYTGMARSLRTQLERSGANVLEHREHASAVLTVVRERAENRVLSVGSRGKATEYELVDEVTFSLSDAAGKVLVEPQTVRSTRDLVFDPNELLGKLSEAENYHVEMRDSLARQILMRIEASLRSP